MLYVYIIVEGQNFKDPLQPHTHLKLIFKTQVRDYFLFSKTWKGHFFNNNNN
jgi:hypothetical protein